MIVRQIREERAETMLASLAELVGRRNVEAVIDKLVAKIDNAAMSETER